MAIKMRGKTLSLYQRVPKRYESVEPRKFVWVSLHTDSRSVAEVKGSAVWSQMNEAWEAKLAGASTDAEERFAAARELAQVRGFRYLPVPTVAKLPVEDLLRRVEAVSVRAGDPDPVEAAAFLGGAKEPEITVSRALELFWQLAKDRTLGKSDDKLRRWRNPRIKAVKNFIDVIGDKPIRQITGDDMLDFRGWWLERLEVEDMTPNSANKDFGHFGDVLRTVNKMKRLGLVLPLSDLAFKNVEAKTRPPFSVAWMRYRLLAPGALDSLNPEARGILLTMVNTGCRPSEIAALRAGQIHLDAKAPHISIEPIGKQLKSANARRVIALTGVSLAAMRAFRDGFPRYVKNSATLSATVNKYLRANGLVLSRFSSGLFRAMFAMKETRNGNEIHRRVSA